MTPGKEPPKKPAQDSKQQQAGGGAGQQHGEGNYEATRQYNAGLKDHVEHHDIEKEARDAAPRSEAEKREMEEAERIGRSKSRGEGRGGDDAPDAAEDPGAKVK